MCGPFRRTGLAAVASGNTTGNGRAPESAQPGRCGGRGDPPVARMGTKRTGPGTPGRPAIRLARDRHRRRAARDRLARVAHQHDRGPAARHNRLPAPLPDRTGPERQHPVPAHRPARHRARLQSCPPVRGSVESTGLRGPRAVEVLARSRVPEPDRHPSSL